MMGRFQRITDERGIALVMALGVLIVISIVTVSLLTYSSSGTRSVRYTDARNKAGIVAEAGLNEAASVLNNCAANPTTCDPRDPAALPSGSNTYDGGASAAWSGSVNGDVWTVTSTSTVRNPSGAASLQRTASTQFRIGVDGEGYAPAWDFTYSDAPSCMTLAQSSAIAVPFWIAGDLCLSNTANPIADEITVKGHITLLNSSMIGSPSKPISKLHTSGCSNSSSGPWLLSNCDAAHHVYATTVDSTFANVTKPNADFTYWYSYSKPGPRNNCTSGSFPGGFDTDTTMNHSRSTVNLLPTTSYSCTFTSNGAVVGKLIWTYGGSSAAGTLQISGVIFIDGDISLSSGQAVYSGRGTIYTTGTVSFSNSSYLCGATDCNATAWDGDNNMITFVAMGCSAWSGSACSTYPDTTFSTSNTSKFQGGVWATNDIQQSQSSLIEGPTISRLLYLNNSSVAQVWPAIDFVSYGAPAPIGSAKLVPITGTYTD